MLTGITITDIGKSMGKHHASVLHGIKLFDNVISKHEARLYEVYAEVLEELMHKPKLYDEPTIYWMEKYCELDKQMEENNQEYNAMVEDYNKLWYKFRYLAGQLTMRGYKSNIIDEPIRQYSKKETRRQEEQRSNQGSLQGAR